MKASRYNLFLEQDNRWIVYNQAAQSILEVGEELKRLLKENKNGKHFARGYEETTGLKNDLDKRIKYFLDKDRPFHLICFLECLTFKCITIKHS